MAAGMVFEFSVSEHKECHPHPETLTPGVVSAAADVFKQNECHHDPTPKPRKLGNLRNPKPKRCVHVQVVT